MDFHHLPPEILEQIFQYIPIGYAGQLDHWSICLVSRSWYASGIRRLYDSPSVIGKNFDAFARTLCPSVNASIRRTELALFVKQLDMSKLVYSGSKSLTARVLGRVKGQLEAFVAPAATFSLLAFSALAKCYRLRVLNLEYVIESLDAGQLLRTVAKLCRLETLSLRMAKATAADSLAISPSIVHFPDSLRRLTVSGTCEIRGATLLYRALQDSKVETLAVKIGGDIESYRELAAAVCVLKLKRLYIDLSTTTRSSDLGLTLLVPEMLYQCRNVEHLSIPLICFGGLFFTTRGFIGEEPYTLKKLTIHHSSMELMGPILSDGDWDQMINNILSGHLQNLKEIEVEDRKDVVKFEELDTSMPGRLDELDEALFDESLQRSGLFLAGRDEYGNDYLES